MDTQTNPTTLSSNWRPETPAAENPSTSFRRLLEIESRDELEKQLDQAVEEAIRFALNHPRHGILVTRHNERTFTVEISQDVPFGLCVEADIR